jgi:hypothetical protein
MADVKKEENKQAVDYTTLGYDKSLNKPATGYVQQSAGDFSLSVDSVDASLINQGAAKSTKLSVDFDKGTVTVKDSNTTRIIIGKFLDGKFGMRVYNSSGSVLIDTSA